MTIILIILRSNSNMTLYTTYNLQRSKFQNFIEKCSLLVEEMVSFCQLKFLRCFVSLR